MSGFGPVCVVSRLFQAVNTDLAYICMLRRHSRKTVTANLSRGCQEVEERSIRHALTLAKAI